MCSSLFGGGSSAHDARLQMIQQQQQLQATRSVSPALPMTSDETRRRGVWQSINDARSRVGTSDMILTGGQGTANYGMAGAPSLAAPVASGTRTVLGG